MKRLFAALALGLMVSIGACATDPSKGPTYAGVGTVDQKTMEKSADTARLSYYGVLQWMAIYVSQPRCGTTQAPPAPLCSSQPVVNEMRRVELAADIATKGAVDIATAPTKSPLALANAVTDAQRAVAVFKGAVAVYKPEAKEVK